MDSGSVSVFLLTHCVREGPADTAEVCTVATHHIDKGGKEKKTSSGWLVAELITMTLKLLAFKVH